MPRNYGGNLDCDQATCTQLEKCRGGTEYPKHSQHPTCNSLLRILLRQLGALLWDFPHGLHGLVCAID